jgi:hypothetical protein
MNKLKLPVIKIIASFSIIHIFKYSLATTKFTYETPDFIVIL